jgi:hypothetical protein
MAQSLGFNGALNRGYMKIFSGTQPVTADSAETGTLLATVTASSAALTKETRATGSVVITAAAGGTINNITVGGLNIIPDGAITAVVGDTPATAALLSEAVNRNGIMEATVSGSTVTLRGRAGSGATTAAVAGSLTTVTATYAAMAGGVASANSLILTLSGSGIIAKLPTQIWSFNGSVAGTAGWFRFYSCDTADTGLTISGAPFYPRLDGSIATSGADLNISNIAIAVGAPNTIDTFGFTILAQ